MSFTQKLAPPLIKDIHLLRKMNQLSKADTMKENELLLLILKVEEKNVVLFLSSRGKAMH